jgi:hypothetical protein
LAWRIHPQLKKSVIMREIFQVPYIKVNPTSTIQYSLLEDGQGNVIRKNIDPLKEEENLRNNSTNGFISKKAKKRLADCVDWINELTSWKEMKVNEILIRYKLTFITLSLPSDQRNDIVIAKAEKLMLRDINNMVQPYKEMMNYIDDVIKKECLNQFLTEMRQSHGMKLYIWRAEAQKNENIHFHIITDIGIEYTKVRDMWNRILNKLGYIEPYRSKHKKLTLEEYRIMYPEKIKIKGCLETEDHYILRTKKAYNFGVMTDWSSPNSTDIHSVKKIRELRKYVTKYLCKEVDPWTDRLIYGRLWFISQALSEARNMTDLVTMGVEDEVDYLVGKNKDSAVYTEHCFILRLTIKEIERLGGVLLPEIFYEKLRYLKRKVYDNEVAA